MGSLRGANLEKLVEFALTRDVETIDIRFFHAGPLREGYYSLQLSNLILMWTKSRCLKQLYLSWVGLTDQDFDLLVNNFLALEILSIENPSYKLKNISIVGHPKLKHFDISRAWELECIKIRDVTNLVSLRFFNLAQGCSLQLTNVPEFTEFRSSDECNYPYVDIFAKLPSCIRDQPQLLHFSTHLIHHPNLRWISSVSLYLFHPLIEACPSLENFKIKFLRRESSTRFINKEACIFHPRKKLSRNLKEFEMRGYLGCRSEFAFAFYIINNAANLEKMIVVPCDSSKTIRRESLARARRDFRTSSPASLKLIII